jgi:hypothetical protein
VGADECGLTLPSSGRLPACFARFQPPLMSNVSRHMRVAPNRIASALFACSALGPLGIWFIMLFTATPTRQSLFQSASETLAFAFTASPAPLFFVLLALLPLVFCFLAIAAWRAPASAWHFKSGLTMVAVASIALAVLVIWEVAFFAAPATYLLVGNRAG